jgi:hypothetical protein
MFSRLEVSSEPGHIEEVHAVGRSDPSKRVGTLRVATQPFSALSAVRGGSSADATSTSREIGTASPRIALALPALPRTSAAQLDRLPIISGDRYTAEEFGYRDGVCHFPFRRASESVSLVVDSPNSQLSDPAGRAISVRSATSR